MMIKLMGEIVQKLLDLLFPPQCAGCRQGGTVLCAICLENIRPIAKPFCQQCHAPLAANSGCWKCVSHALQLSGLRSASIYQGPLRSCIHALKYNGVTQLTQPLGMLLARTWREVGMHGDLVVPVPLHAERQRRRGYNHAALLARVCAQEMETEYSESILTRIRDTQAQARLSVQERASNVAGAFRCAPGARACTGRRVILIDDVFTTGATLEECAKPLFAAGARSVWGLVLARSL